MVDGRGYQKGMKLVLEERGHNTSTMNGEDMRVVLSNHSDFIEEKTLVESYFIALSHDVIFIAKFHCEL